MHAMVTGGRGWLGSVLVNALLSAGHTVSVFDAATNGADFVSHKPSQLRLYQAGLANMDALAKAMTGADIVYHLADRTDELPAARHILRLTDTNVVGTANVIAAAKLTGIPKIVYTSSSEVYGNVVGAKESDMPTPVTLVGATKLAAEALLRGAYHSGMDVVILRLYTVWNTIQSLLDVLATADVSEHSMQTRDFVHMTDVIKALVASYRWENGIYNIGTGVEVSMPGLYSILSNGAKPVAYKGAAQSIDRACADISYTKTTVSWVPTVVLTDYSPMELQNCYNNRWSASSSNS